MLLMENRFICHFGAAIDLKTMIGFIFPKIIFAKKHPAFCFSNFDQFVFTHTSHSLVVSWLVHLILIISAIKKKKRVLMEIAAIVVSKYLIIVILYPAIIVIFT